MAQVWGDEIVVNGVRPSWLADDVEVRVWNTSVPAMCHSADSDGVDGYAWACIRGIRLPVEHFAYAAIERGFEPWGGGNMAPDDWDGGEVLKRDGNTWRTVYGSTDWQRGLAGDPTVYPLRDIIGYRKKVAEQPQREAQADTVTIRRMTEADVEPWLRANGWHILPTHRLADVRDLFRDLGIIREESRIERFARITGVEITDANRSAVEAALGFRD